MKVAIIRLLALSLLVAARGNSQVVPSIILTAPTNATSVSDGRDFATQVVGNPWDMNQLRDLPLDVGYWQPNNSGGVWSGLVLEQYAYVFPLSPGFIDPLCPSYYARYDAGTPYGPLNPVNAAIYTHLSFRMSMDTAVRSFISCMWTKDKNTWPADNTRPILTGRTWILDQEPSINPNGYVIINNPTGYRMYDIGLRGDDWMAERNQLLVLTNYIAYAGWGGTIYGIELWPSASAPLGSGVQFDWIRLYDYAHSPTVTVTWTATEMPDDGRYSIWLYIDSDTNNYDGDLYMTGISDDGDYTLHTAALPPGYYYIYLKAIHHENGGFTTLATSAYSEKIHIDAPPLATFIAPSYTSGDDYASKELSNAWDFSSATDVGSSAQIASVTYTGNMLTAITTGNDSQILPNMKRNGANIPINTQKYRYLTFRMKADTTGYTNIVDRIRRQWVAELMWWNQGLAQDGTDSQEVPLLEGWHSYTVDLWDTNFINPRKVGMYPQKGWNTLPQVTALRFDPIEVTNPVTFWLDDIKLCADAAPSNNSYQIKWRITDPDSTSITVRIYYRYNSGGRPYEYPTPLVTVTQVPGTKTYKWNMANLPNDDYFLRLQASDGVNTYSITSAVPIRLQSSFPRMNVRSADPAVFQESSGSWWIVLAGPNGPTGILVQRWGFPGSVPVPGDFDGDGKSDMAVFYSVTGKWYIKDIANKILAWNFAWGWPGATPVSGDYDGDGKSDLAVLDENSGRWYVWSLANNRMLVWNLGWGWPGAKPVSGDYDSDGKSDLAVLDVNVGRWYIFSVAKGRALAWNLAWGWAGCSYVPGDFDGDGASDLGIYDRTASRWYVFSLKTWKAIHWGTAWGFAGVTPVSVDFNNDRATDLVVYYPTNGYWYIRYSGGGTEQAGPWGGVGLQPVTGNFDGQ